MNSYLKQHRRGAQKGFTLIELLVVIAIIGLLASVTMASLSEARKKADDSKKNQELGQIKVALELYFSNHNAYPSLAQADNGPVRQQKQSLGFLSRFVKIADAQSTDASCGKFVSMANMLVSEGLLTAVPTDPNPSTCYMAWGNGNIIAVYGYMWNKYSFTDANKKVGFVLTKDSAQYQGGGNGYLQEACLGTGNDYNDPYPVFDPKASGNAMCSGTTIADKVLGVTGGVEVADDGTEVGGGGSGSCSDSAYSSEVECIKDRSYCSDSTFLDQSSCENALCGGHAASCSVGTSTTQSECEGALCGGSPSSCSGGNSYADQSSCEGAVCSVSSGGYCSSSSYTDQSSCEGARCNVIAPSCSGGSYTDQPSCEYAQCSTGQYTGYCSGQGLGSQGSCEAAQCDVGDGNYANCGYFWTQTELTSSCNYTWSNGYAGDSCGYTWTPNVSSVSCGYAWNAGTSASNCGYTWNQAEAPTASCGNIWIPVSGGVWTP